ncbi:hypothetical protein GCM10010207_66940 [Streptomyces atratus]|uniref:B3/B4 domain-containing protein n=1 Tax=Streptomyces atratus TaxID=1893 RepID=UPI00167150C5|nr:phenylalanine--tRNA ligase beta subunit-related protein [Streptomyces atratus]GGT57843.1 hypothetical protein GCM10010207_66940 [Streptomyces atratus]
MALAFTLADGESTLAPALSHLAVEARSLVNGPATTTAGPCWTRRLDGRAPHEAPHLAARRDTCTAFGAKPSRTRNSAEALVRRVLTDAGLPRINLLVDLYNAIGVAHPIPVGGEDTDRINGTMQLVRSTGQEPFATVAGSEETVEHPEPGEVVRYDDEGVTCRRWNWRQGVRTRLTEESVNAVFLLERLAPMTIGELEAAGAELVEWLEKLSPGARITVGTPE